VIVGVAEKVDPVHDVEFLYRFRCGAFTGPRVVDSVGFGTVDKVSMDRALFGIHQGNSFANLRNCQIHSPATTTKVVPTPIQIPAIIAGPRSLR
jgi:hypothetical protein